MTPSPSCPQGNSALCQQDSGRRSRGPGLGPGQETRRPARQREHGDDDEHVGSAHQTGPLEPGSASPPGRGHHDQPHKHRRVSRCRQRASCDDQRRDHGHGRRRRQGPAVTTAPSTGTPAQHQRGGEGRPENGSGDWRRHTSGHSEQDPGGDQNHEQDCDVRSLLTPRDEAHPRLHGRGVAHRPAGRRGVRPAGQAGRAGSRRQSKDQIRHHPTHRGRDRDHQ